MLSKNNRLTFLIGVLILVCSFILVGCGNTTNDESKQDINEDEFNIPAPMPVGEISLNVKSGILSFKGAAQINGNSAIFGEGEDALYVQGILQNNRASVNVGGKDINNTIPIADPIYVRIYRTSTKDGITLYIFKRAHDMYCDYLIIGRKTDGTFVKYIDTKEVSLKYFGNLGKQATIIFEDKVLIKGSTLSFNCFYYKFGAKNYPGDKACRFNFNWNEHNQSFDIEQTEQQFQKQSAPPRNTAVMDLTDNELKINDIFSDTDYKLLSKIPKIDYSAKAIGLTVKEFEDLIGWPMVEASPEAKTTLFGEYYEIGLNREQCKHITFYQRKGEDPKGNLFHDLIGVKEGIIVIYVGLVPKEDIREIVQCSDADPVQLQYNKFHRSYCYWKGNNCYIALKEYNTFEETKKTLSEPGDRGRLIQYLGDMHYSAIFKIGFPVNMMIGGD